MRTTRDRLAQHRPNPDVLKRIEAAAAHIEQSAERGEVPEENWERTLDTSTAWETRDVPSGAVEVIEDLREWPQDQFGDRESQPYDGVVGRVMDDGLDCIAFYKSFRDVHRAPAPRRWGIFFIKRRCIGLARTMALDTGESFSISLEALVELLYAHELYHYKIDAHCLQTESTGGALIYRPYRHLVRSLPMDEWYEESVANRYGLAALDRDEAIHLPSSLKDFLHQIVASSPGAYRQGIHKGQSLRKDLISEQASQHFARHHRLHALQDLARSTIRLGTNLRRPVDETLGTLLKLDFCPVYWIDWVKQGLTVIRPLTVSVKEVRKEFVERYLSGRLDHRSDHEYYKIDNGELVKIPNSHDKDIRGYELKNIAGKAGMTLTDYEAARRATLGWKKHVPRSEIVGPLPAFSKSPADIIKK